MTPRFELGRTVITPAALGALSHEELIAALRRHHAGDWGDLCPEDVQANEQALEHGARLLSSYRAADGTVYWIITEADRSATTVLLPEDY